MLTLHLSKNLGVTYRTVEHFDNLIVANEYLEKHKSKLASGRWFIDDENCHILVVCQVFEAVAKHVGDGYLGLSEDPNLRRYLLQQRLIKVSGICI